MNSEQRPAPDNPATVPRPRDAGTAIQAMFAAAAQHHQAGRLGDAERLYRQILADVPHHADSLHLLGVIACQVGRHDLGAELIGQAISVDARVAAYHSNRGAAFNALGQVDDAATCFRHAIALKPDYAEAHYNLGNALKALGRLDEAASSYRTAIALRPDYAEAHSNLGNMLREQGCLDEAVASCRRATILRPDLAEGHANLGTALREQGRLDEAAASCRQAVVLRPDLAVAQSSLGRILLDLGRLEEAAAAYRRAVDLMPDSPESGNNLGVALRDLGRLDEAVACFRRVVALDPDHVEAHNNLGVALRDLGRPDEAIACFRRAIALDPDLADAHNNLGNTLLLVGDYPEGWREYEWRFRGHEPFPQPRWAGEDLHGRRILVWGEQGIGDEIIYFALLPDLLARGARVVAECDPRMVAVLDRALPQVEAVARTNPPDRRCLAGDIDVQIAAGSVAAYLGPTCTAQPLAPYLRPDPAAVAALRRRYGHGQGAPLVGISWRSQSVFNGRCGFSLAQWRPILEVPGIRFVSVQYGDCRAEIDTVRREFGATILLDDDVDPLADMDRAIAQIAAMDLTITMANSTVTMTSMLGAEAFCAISALPHWRTSGGDRSLWFPRARLFRQAVLGDWGPVIGEMAEALRQRYPIV